MYQHINNLKKLDLTCNQFVEIIRAIVWEHESRKLRPSEEAALKAGWERVSYEEYLEKNGIQLAASSIKQNAYLLYPLIRRVIGIQKLNKSNIRKTFKALFKDGKLDKYLGIGHLQTLSQRLKNYEPEHEYSEVTDFVGRQIELDELEKLVSKKRCIQVWGEPGIGKTALIAEFSKNKAISHFHYIYSKFRTNLSLQDWAQETLFLIGIGRVSDPLKDLIYLLIEEDILLVIDNAQNFPRLYPEFLSNFIYFKSKSVIIVCSNILIGELEASEQIGNLHLKKIIEFKELFTKYRLKGKSAWEILYEKYNGNTAQIIHAINIIINFFDSDVSEFIESSSTVFSEDAYMQVRNSQLTELDITILKFLIRNKSSTAGKVFKEIREKYNNKYNSESIFNRFTFLENSSFLHQENGKIIISPIVKRYIMEKHFDTV